MTDPNDVGVHDFRFDDRNLAHLARHGASEELVWEIWLDQPIFIWNREDLTATHLMIGMDGLGVLWTVAMILADEATATWRPITCFPTEREDERKAWYGET